ncbi:PREDICTED: vitellogenin-like [Nicrophorus vespilloides]|uniref:Vitellogenin-like n=2 Tax=Nicrophorus vespilloides TaxID=110193 RepID=A0ABM1MVQ0_NICVS|nr:PREDICTED: vitellogenin-like [Nicrophorus vespilloides]
MWSRILLCCLVGLAAASNNHGWQNNKEYVYKVQGRTLTGLQDVANEFSGIVMKGNLVIRPQSEGKLMAKIVDAKYSQVHSHLKNGWKSEIPESKLQYQQLPLCDKPFEIQMQNGVVRAIVVSKDVQTWESNIIKSFVSQIQLDVQGENVVNSHMNQLPEADSDSAVFKTMEETVTGKYETLYEISPLPEYVLQSQPWLVPMPELKNDGEFIEVVKSKNFSRGEERLGYYYGLGSMGRFEPNTNKMGDFFTRSANSRAVISGNLKRFTIQSSASTNKMILRPTLNSQEKGMVVSHLNLTLSRVQEASSSFEQLHDGQKLNSLTYTFNIPFGSNKQQQQQKFMYSSGERQHYRSPRSLRFNSEESQSESVESQESWAQEESELRQPPQSPLLPFTMGYKGKNIKKSEQVDAVESAKKLAQQIGKELQKPEEIAQEQSLAKFIVLTSLNRIMTEKEMEQVAEQLYTKETQGPKAEAWFVFRDSIAQCGTGPALLTINQWIKTEKISYEEAAQIISTMAQSVRQPTEEYMRTFFRLATKEQQIKSQAILNDTALLSFTTLVRKVYVNKHVSHNQFPVHSFGKFRTESGKRFVEQEVIPELKQQLQQAIQSADSHKILVFVRALGNVAHESILAIFEPYLEGHKQVSQFQRFHMVLALDKFVKVKLIKARSVLYKIYQNQGELEQIRVAAVYQLMRTCPPASMLQRMAQFTNVDTHEQVNAAVQSAIRSAATLEGQDYKILADNARSAEPLLTKKNYGAQYSKDNLHSFVQKEMSMFYIQNIQSFGSRDSIIPRGISYALRNTLGGAKHELINTQYMISNIDELINVCERLSQKHQHQQKQQQQNFQQAQNNQWSSESISKLLNMKTSEREQLEASFYLQLSGGATRFFTLNNRTVELIPRVLRDIEESLANGKEIQYTKVWNSQEIAISFPTEMAFPFIYTLDAPTVIRIQGQVRAQAQPRFSNGDKLNKPETVSVESDIHALVSTKIQARFGFITPFDHQQYSSGFDKNVQVNLPLKSKLNVDIKKQNINMELQPSKPERDAQIFHYSSWPYTAKHNILNLEPLSKQHNTKVIRTQEQPQTQFHGLFGKQTGMAFRVQYTSEQRFFDARWVYEQLSRQDLVSAFLAPMNDESILYTDINVKYISNESSARKVQLRLAFQHKTEQEGQQTEINIKEFNNLPQEVEARQAKFSKMAASGIKNAEICTCDMAVQFDGHNKVHYAATAAFAKSLVDDKSRVLFFAKKESANHQECKPFEFAVAVKARIPNTNGLNYQYALDFSPKVTAQFEFVFGKNLQSSNQINVHAQYDKSESRRRFLKNHPRSQECRREMEQENYQLPACANMTQEANLLDRVQVHVQFENMSQNMRNMTYKLYNAIRYMGYYNLDENRVDPQNDVKENQIEMEARFDADFQAVNVSFKTQEMNSRFENVRLNKWVKKIVVGHPVFTKKQRVMSEILGYDTFLPFCVVDKNAANTLDNKTYPINLGNSWTVMMQYVPTFARVHHHQQKHQEQQEELQTEQHAVFVRDDKSGHGKEVKITLRNARTQAQLVEVDIQPQGQRSGPCAKITINGKQIQYNIKQVTVVEGGLIKVYGLPNDEVKIELEDNYYIIYDGERVKLTVVDNKFRGSVRGLCGTFTGEKSDDFLTPRNCILRDPREFAATYTIERKGHNQEFHSRAQKSPCFRQEVIYANVISDIDAGRVSQPLSHKSNNHQSHSTNSNSCTKHQTRYVEREDDNEICFSVRSIPSCNISCRHNKMIGKSVEVHCVPRTNVSEMWRNQIQKGANPDFSQKAVHKSLKMEVPDNCYRN